MARMAEQLDIRNQRYELKLRRGKLTIGPRGQLEGLWPLVRRELRTVAQVCELAGVTRHTLIAWRERRDFPPPVLTLKKIAGPRAVELWSRTDVEAWLERNPRRRAV